MLVSNIKKLRWSAVILGVSNILVVSFGAVLMILVYPTCEHRDILPLVLILLVFGARITAMIRTGVAQGAVAHLILNSQAETEAVGDVIRHDRRMRYKRWLWWTRFTTLITVLQLVGASYLVFSIAKHFSLDQPSSNCISVFVSKGTKWQQNILVLFMIMVCFVALVQCFTGSDVLRWRYFYATEDIIWKAHYREIFDHGIREALCCLGRVKYLTVMEKDEVFSVAQLLGDLVAYRASGTGHLELLAGLALLQTQKHSQSPKPYEEFVEAPEDRIHEAAAFHPFAEAAYTGLLLDLGRNPILFPCAWLSRQGILTPWRRKRWPVLDGDNWWRGHAAAFLKYVDLSPEVLRRGRVNQTKCEAAYFIVVLHHLKSVVIAVRGTETPEDLITDGLCGECSLTPEDLDGLIKERVVFSSPHYGHSGVVEAARDLFMQIEGNTNDDDSSSHWGGFLSTLLGAGCECEGYSVRIVGHSLGGAIAALLGIRLYSRYPNLHVYTYGSLPCVDSVVADACSGFVTSIVYDNEFSSRLSVASILRLRAAAITALSEDAATDSSIMSKLAHRFLFLNNHQLIKNADGFLVPNVSDGVMKTSDTKHPINGNQKFSGSREPSQEVSFWQQVDVEHSSHDEIHCTDLESSFTNPFHGSSADVNSYDDPASLFLKVVPSSESSEDLVEMFLPGLVIHIVPQRNSFHMPLWNPWRTQEKGCDYRAYIAHREAFRDISVSPSMFLDHLPWRCHYAMNKVLEMQNPQVILHESQMV